MSVFDEQIKTPLRVDDPLSDRSLPGAGKLSWTAKNRAQALDGTAGIDAKLVHGDRWQTIDANFTEQIAEIVDTHIGGDERHRVMGDLTIKIHGNQQETIMQTYTHTIVGNHVQSNLAARSDTYGGPHTITHLNVEQKADSTKWFNWEPYKFEIIGRSIGVNVVKMEATYQTHEVNAIKLELLGVGVEAALIKEETKLVRNEKELVKNDIHPLKNNIAAVQPRVAPLRAEVSLRVSPMAISMLGVGAK